MHGDTRSGLAPSNENPAALDGYTRNGTVPRWWARPICVFYLKHLYPQQLLCQKEGCAADFFYVTVVSNADIFNVN